MNELFVLLLVHIVLSSCNGQCTAGKSPLMALLMALLKWLLRGTSRNCCLLPVCLPDALCMCCIAVLYNVAALWCSLDQTGNVTDV
jgi:hypothetical protein